MLHPILGDFHHRLLRMAWRRNCTTWRLAAVRCATFCCPCWPGSLQSDSPLRRAMQWLFLEVLTLESLTASLKIWLDVEAQLEKLKYIVESLNSQCLGLFLGIWAGLTCIRRDRLPVSNEFAKDATSQLQSLCACEFTLELKRWLNSFWLFQKEKAGGRHLHP
ncbi:unnamed protein product [Durusdinium trenchii]|uniref:Uncharacterized protein n=1 Tax=Durusdinium trenchii TaxID=1381693 RepID=A0ABP0IJE7_9DINO